MVPQPPEHPQDPEQVRQRPAVVGQVPAHRGGQIGRLRLQPHSRVILVEAPQLPVSPLSHRPVVIGVAAPDLGDVGPSRQPLCDEPADDVQHPQPRAGCGVVELDQAAAGQCLRQIQHPVLGQASDLAGGVDGPAVHEDRHGLQQRPLIVVQQVHAPLHGVSQCALPLRKVH